MTPGSSLVRSPRQSFESSRRRNGEHAAVVGAHDLPAALMNDPVMSVAEGLLPKDPFGVVVRPNGEAIQVKTRFDVGDGWKAADRAA